LKFRDAGFCGGRKSRKPGKIPSEQGGTQQQTQSTYDTRPESYQGAVSRKPRKLFGPVKPWQNLEPHDYRAVLFTYSYFEETFPSYKKFHAYTLLQIFEKRAPGHIGEKRVLSPLHNPCSPE